MSISHTNREEIDEKISKAVELAFDQRSDNLTQDERRWVRLAIQKEAQSIRLRQSIIEKTITSLIWSALVAFGAFIWNAMFHTPKG